MSKSPTDTSTRLLEAAASIVAEGGLRALTTRSLAAAAGVAPGVVHYQLGSVARLRLRLAEREGAARLARARALWSAPAPIADRLRAWVALPARDVADGRARVWRELAAAGWADPALGQVIAAVDAGVEQAVRAAFEAAAGELAVPVAAAAPIATLLSAAGAGLELQRLSRSDAGHAELELWLEAALRAATAPPG
jgi:AcrR family transcriptional regulator